MRQRICVQWLAAAVLMVLSAPVAHATEGVVVGDAYVNSLHATTNYGSLSNLYVNSTGTTLIQFDLSSLPAGTTASQIGSASLKLYVNRVNSVGVVSVQPITGTWSESAVTYASYSSSLALGSAVASFTPATSQQFIVIDITSLVQGWVTTPSSNNGLALTTSLGDVVFDSKENDETSHAAHLDITVVSQGPQGPAGPTGAAGATGAAGQTGAAGAAGAQGPAGPQGAIGPAGPFAGGVYSASVDYPAGSVVQNSSATYLAIQANGPSSTVITPGTNTAYWVGTGGSGTTPANYIAVTAAFAFGSVPTGASVFADVAGLIAQTSPSGFVFDYVTGAVTVTTAGTYLYDYDVDVNEAGYLELQVNTITAFHSTFGRATGTSQIVGHGAITLNAGDVVTLINSPSSSSALTIPPFPSQVGASLTLVALAAGTQGPAGPAGATGPAGAAGPAGPMGAPGPGGATGAAGATGATGLINFLGPYNSGTTYNIGDSVSYTDGNVPTSSYISMAAGNTGNLPTIAGNNAFWDLVAQAGSEGALGATGAQGPQGDPGAPGAAGSQGPQGNAGTDGAAATISVGSTTTGSPGSQASVTNSGTSSAAVLHFQVPQGQIGGSGPAGPQGPAGPTVGGTYSNSVTYPAGSVVVYQGSTYVAIASTNGNAPTNASFWTATGGVAMGGSKTGTVILANTSNPISFYRTLDNSTVTLPSTPTSGQQILLFNTSCASANTGFSIHGNTSQTLLIVNGSGTVLSGASVTPIYCSINLIYDGTTSTWYSVGAFF